MSPPGPGRAIWALIFVTALALHPPLSAADSAGRWLSSDPPSDHPALGVLPVGSALQCGLRCLVEPLCAGLRVAASASSEPALSLDCWPVTCPAEWSVFSGACYRAFTPQLSWLDAEAACGSAVSGGHLVSIASAAENSFVSSLAQLDGGDFYHVGLFWPQGSAAGAARWTDGSQVTFTAWYTSQPNENRAAGMVGTNLMPNLQQWNDMRVGTSHGYICEYTLASGGQ